MKAYHYSQDGTVAMVSTLPVDPADRDHDEVVITAHIKGNDVTDDLRYRSVYMPAEVIFGGVTAMLDDKPSTALLSLVHNALLELARARLKDDLGDTRSLKSVVVNDYSVAALLAWNIETAAARGSLSFTKDQALTWFDASSLSTKLIQKNPKAHAALRIRVAALAAKNHGIKFSKDATAILALIPAEDVATGIGSDIVARLAHISAALAEKEQEESLDFASISLD